MCYLKMKNECIMQCMCCYICGQINTLCQSCQFVKVYWFDDMKYVPYF